MKKNFKLSEISDIKLDLKPWTTVFLTWDLAAWKTTLSKHFINNLLWVSENITSPTYTYYNKYSHNIFHFDLYRLNNYDEFVQIGWEEILDNPNNICIIEWPEILRPFFKADLDIHLHKTDNDDERILEIK